MTGAGMAMGRVLGMDGAFALDIFRGVDAVKIIVLRRVMNVLFRCVRGRDDADNAPNSGEQDHDNTANMCKAVH